MPGAFRKPVTPGPERTRAILHQDEWGISPKPHGRGSNHVQGISMTELEQILVGDAAAAPPSRILEALPPELEHKVPPGAPHSIYEQLWHITFWQQVTLDCI